MDYSVKEKIIQIDSLFVATNKLQLLLNDIKRVRDIAEITGYAKEPTCILVTGETGTGKTAFIDQYQLGNPITEGVENTNIPVLVSSLPKAKHPKPVVAQLLRDLGDPLEGRGGDTHELTDRLIKQSKAANVKLFIIDEFHHAIQTQSFQVVLDVADLIKVIINKAKIPVVLFGLPWSSYVMDVSKELDRRFNVKHEMNNYTLDQFADFQKFLQKVQKKLPIPVETDLWRAEQAFRLFAATEGNVSNLMKKLIRPAAMNAVFEGADHINDIHLLEASRHELLLIDDINPLLLDLNKIVAKEQKSLSRWNHDAGKGKSRIVEASYKNVGIDHVSLADVF